MTATNYHFIGMGGSGMSTIAHLFLDHGWQITGSDREGLFNFRKLQERGVTAWVGTDPERIPEGSVIVRSTAIRDTNPEMVYAREKGLQVLHRSQALALLAGDDRFVAVAGTHGKTTTSSMIAYAITECGADPSFAIGGVINAFGTGAHWGKDDLFVAEADESDKSFLNYAPTVAVINSVEPDHLDNYHTGEAYAQAFVDFVDRVKDGGVVILNLDDPTCCQLLRQARGGQDLPLVDPDNPPQPLRHSDRPSIHWWGYGQRPVSELDLPVERYVQIDNGQSKASGVSANFVVYEGTAQPNSDWSAPSSPFNQIDQQAVTLALPGMHNLYNLAAAWLAGCFLEFNGSEVAAALAKFKGAKRRFQLLGDVNNVQVYDDYAHHPSEIEVMIAQARTVADDRGGRVLCLHQPHLFSRTTLMLDRFAEVLSKADLNVIPDICAAREDPWPGVTSLILTEKLPNSIYVGPMTDAATKMAYLARPKDLIVVFGAGDINKITPQIITDLETRFQMPNVVE